MSGLEGRVALVTGGSRGIGRAVSLALARAGADVAVNYLRREAEAQDTARAIEAEGRRALLMAADVGQPGRVEELVAAVTVRLGRLDVFVSCAVAPVARKIMELTPADWERSLAVNARAFVFGGQAAARAMGRGPGRIVAISATGAHLARNPSYAPLAMAKGAVEAAVRYLAVELAPRGITVNAVAPGPTDTLAFRAMAGSGRRLGRQLAARTPMGRLGSPEDAARLVAFLCSQEAGWITGQVIFSDGGFGLL